METEAEILDADNDSQKLWSILNEVVDRKQLKHRNPERFTNAGKSITKPMAIADGLNKYFAMIGQKMADTIPDTEGYQQHVRRSYGLFKLARPNSEYVGKIMSKQQPKLSCGLDTINNKVVKQCSNELAIPMEILIGHSIKEGYILQIQTSQNYPAIQKRFG